MKNEIEQKELKGRLMAWTPGAPDFSRDDVIVAVGLQCMEKRFPVQDVIQWLGPPAKCWGDASDGHLVYFYSYDFWGAPMFDVAGGKVIHFGVVNIKNPNAKRIDPKTGKEISFNMLDEMEPYNEAAFK
jgi:hypothetical protein